MTKIRIDTQDALDLLEAQVAKRGADYRYQDEFGDDCQYFVDGRPGCIIGGIFADLGLTEDRLIRKVFVDGDPSVANESFVMNLDLDLMGLDVSPYAVNVLQQAQWSQDSDDTWGQALEHARQYASGGVSWEYA
jgi:hypothetical protein